METDRDELFSEVLQDTVKADIAFRVNASIILHRFKMKVNGSPSWMWDVALGAIERYKDVIIGAIEDCYSIGMTGRNQEEAASARVIRTMMSNGDLDCFDIYRRERLEDVLEAMIQPMRYYFVNDAYVRSLREQLSGYGLEVPDVSEMDGRP